MQNPWKDIVNYPLGSRGTKPRKTGLTMVIDKGLGKDELRNLFEISGEYIDYLKLGFGTSALYNQKLLEYKIKLCIEYKIEAYPGGTLMEIAFIQGQFETFLKRAKSLGFNTIEISDGTIYMDSKTRQKCIKRAVKEGFSVLTEVGKKNPEESPTNLQLLDLVYEDLSAGAYKVILEARESGKGIGIYDQKGQIIEDKIRDFTKRGDDIPNLIWEAPLKNQQVDLISRFGSGVNLGNIQPNEVLALEALRAGLRGDTFSLTLNKDNSVTAAK